VTQAHSSAFALDPVLFLSPGQYHPYHTTDSALRKFDFLLNKIHTVWTVLVRFFISLLGQRYTMFRDYGFPFPIATYTLHCLSATLASIARI